MQERKKTILQIDNGKKIEVKEEGFELKRENRTVGSRVIIDTYQKTEVDNIVLSLEEEIMNLKKQKEKIEKDLVDVKKVYHPREKPKIRDFLLMFQKAEAMKKYEQMQDQLMNINFALERDAKDIEQLKSIK